jgi:hypothetical protein
MCCPNANTRCMLHKECRGKGGACTNKPGGCIGCLGKGTCERCDGKGNYKKPNGDTVGCPECYDPGNGIKRTYSGDGKYIRHVSWSNLSSRIAQYKRIDPKYPRSGFRWSALACAICPVPPLYRTTATNMSVGSTQVSPLHSAGSAVAVARPISAEMASAASAGAFQNARNARAEAPGR